MFLFQVGRDVGFCALSCALERFMPIRIFLEETKHVNTLRIVLLGSTSCLGAFKIQLLAVEILLENKIRVDFGFLLVLSTIPSRYAGNFDVTSEKCTAPKNINLHSNGSS